MSRKKSNTTKKRTILRNSEVEYLVGRITQSVTPEIMEMANDFGLDLDKIIRFTTVAKQCALARERLGRDVKGVSRELGLPQYRIQAIEDGRFREFSQKELILYVELLGIKEWFQKWRRVNRKAFLSLQSIPDRRTPWARRVAGRSA
jgi:hypothetical protein